MKLIFSLTALIVLSLTFTSCEKEDETPAYVGTWVNEITETVEIFGEMTVTTTLVLTKSTYDISSSFTIADVPIPAGGTSGDLSVNGNTITISPTSITAYDIDEETGELIEMILNKGDDGWEEALVEMEMSASESATYSIDGNKMTVTFEGEDDSMVFTKK